MNTTYIGEHLWPGQLGHVLVILAFSTALLSTLSYFFSARNSEQLESNAWHKMGRFSFLAHGTSVIAIMGLLFYMIFKHMFEYQYVWQHSSKSLPVRYMLSCFWEGQEGSFLLWTFWHVVLGLVVMSTSGKRWEAPVMTVVASVQVFLVSMLLGVYFGDYRLGSHPFLLLREHPEFQNLPFTKVPNYLAQLDGRGLNPLLQNYWMTIHPPTLFLGFASTLIPFSFAIAGLWKNRPQEWLQQAIPWTFFGIMILGTGILMGGAWAYESLSFGGFWAWDPVENASLVPWLTLVAAGHVMLIHRANGKSLASAFGLSIITFILILYSTFLTRSGILGNTSVHAFTDLGMSGQLLVYLIFYIAAAFALVVYRRALLFRREEEEAANSREFWMFIGSLVLCVSAFQIIFTTSIPVINKIFGSNIAPPTKPIEHYNSWQVPIAILIALLIAVTQFLKYKKTNIATWLKQLMWPFVVATILAVLMALGLEMKHGFHIGLLWASVFAAIANGQFLLRNQKINLGKGGASIAHIGFGLILLGALISTSTSTIISRNTSQTDVSKLGKDYSNRENILLRRNDTLQMGPYRVFYRGKVVKGIDHFFEVVYLEPDNQGKYHQTFVLRPLVQANPRMGNAAEPDTRHFWNRDVYTHITYVDLAQVEAGQEKENRKETKHTLSSGDTLYTANAIVVLEGLFKQNDVEGLLTPKDRQELGLKDGDLAVGAHMRILDVKGKVQYANPLMIIRGNLIDGLPAEIDSLGLEFSFVHLNPDNGKVDIVVKEKQRSENDFIVMKAIVFPYINILWLGMIILVVGTTISIFHRIRLAKKNRTPATS
jgi:cytochrome c-type biogenesis protein CcmF